MGWITRKLGIVRILLCLHPENRKHIRPNRRLDKLGWAALDTQIALDIWMRVNGIR